MSSPPTEQQQQAVLSPPPPPPQAAEKRPRLLLDDDLAKQVAQLQETNLHFRNQISAGERQHCELQQNFIHKIQQMSTSTELLQKSHDKLKLDNAALKQSADRAYKEVAKAKSEAKELDELKLQVARLEASPASVAALEEEYLSGLQEWVSSHQNSVKLNALAVFHGTKPRAKHLWHVLHEVHKVTVFDLLQRAGMKRNLLYVRTQVRGEDDTILGLQLPPKNDLGVTDLTLRTGREDINRRVVLWLEEQNGMASWRDFTDMFGTASSLLTPADVVQSPELVCIPSQTIEGEMVLVSSRRADYVLGQMFCHYLKQAGRKFVPSVEFSSFLESTPGAVQLRERVTGELSPSILANKFPDLIYYWKQEGKGMVCLRADKERAEIDQLEVQRQALELMSQVERDKMDAEKKLAEERAQFDREERKRSEWRQQQQQQQQQQYSPPQFAQYAPPPPQAAASTSAPGYHAYAPQYAGYSAQSYPPPTQQQGVVYPPPPGAQQYYPPAAYPQQQQQPPPSQTYFPPPPPSWQPRS